MENLEKNKKETTKKCKHCKSDIPGSAKVCPVCRKKQSGGCLVWALIGIAVLVVLGAAAGLKEDKPKKVGDQETAKAGTENAGTQNEKDTAPEKDIFAVGETAEMNNVQVTMTNYQESAGSEWNKPTEGNVFVLTEFEIANNSDSELAISSMVSFEAYVDDYAANLSFGALVENEQTQLDGTVAPGKKMKGWVGYEVPAGWTKMEVYFKDNVWSNSKFKFEITK